MVITNTLNGLLAISEGIKGAMMAFAAGKTFLATAAQHGFNSALLACPITWIVLLIIALIAALVALCNWIAETTGIAESGIGIIVGALAVAAAFIGNLFVAVINFVIDIFITLWNFIAAFVNFFANVFIDPVGSIARLFFDLVDMILGLLQSLASAIDTIFGSNLAGAVRGWRDDLDGWVEKEFGDEYELVSKKYGEDYHIDRFNYGDAWDAGVKLGDGLADSISGFNPDDLTGNIPDGYDASNIPSNISTIADNTDSIKDSMDITSEDLKYLRDMAERDVVNRFTTAEIKVEMTNNNSVSSDMDLDGIVNYLANGVNEAMERAAEGVH